MVNCECKASNFGRSLTVNHQNVHVKLAIRQPFNVMIVKERSFFIFLGSIWKYLSDSFAPSHINA